MSRILLVDDDPDLLLSLQELLQTAGFEVIATTNGLDAMRFVEELPPDAAVLDAVMPQPSGFELVRQLRAHRQTAQIPILLVSGLSSPKDRIQGLTAGADDYLTEPFAPEELVLRLQKLLARYEAIRAATAEQQHLEEALAQIEQAISEGRPIRGMHLGRYRLDAILGKGGYGTVFRAFDQTLLRPVAIKVLHMPEEDEDFPELRSHLLREAVAGARLSHPHIVAVHDFQETRQAAFIVMELVEGVGLDRYIPAMRRLSPSDTVVLGLAVSQALACAHGQHLVHHDLKPANVLLGRDGAIKVSDFGISTFLSNQAPGPGEVFGTPGFLAPECIRGQPYDQKGDLFALGVTLYLCLTGENPFFAGDVLETLEKTLTYEPKPPRTLREDVPEDLSQLVMRLLAKDRTQRPSSAGEVANVLDRWVRDRKLRWSPDLAAFERAFQRPSIMFRSVVFRSEATLKMPNPPG